MNAYGDTTCDNGTSRYKLNKLSFKETAKTKLNHIEFQCFPFSQSNIGMIVMECVERSTISSFLT